MKPKMNAKIYLTGTEAYGKYYDYFSRHEKKRDFEKLFVNVDSALVYINRTTEKKYINKILSLGYKVICREELDMFDIRISIERG